MRLCLLFRMIHVRKYLMNFSSNCAFIVCTEVERGTCVGTYKLNKRLELNIAQNILSKNIYHLQRR